MFRGPITAEMALDILDGIHIMAMDIDPEAGFAHFTWDNKEYHVLDSYCLNPSCECAHVGLRFFPV
jgi:hypothetical protein